jgi:hypothetical protein
MPPQLRSLQRRDRCRRGRRHRGRVRLRRGGGSVRRRCARCRPNWVEKGADSQIGSFRRQFPFDFACHDALGLVFLAANRTHSARYSVARIATHPRGLAERPKHAQTPIRQRSCHQRAVVVLRHVLAWCWLAELPRQRALDMTTLSSDVARAAQEQEILERAEQRIAVFDCEAMMDLLRRVMTAVLTDAVLNRDLPSSQG